MALSLINFFDDMPYGDDEGNVFLFPGERGLSRELSDRPGRNLRTIPVDFVEEKDVYKMYAEMPGIKKSQIKVDVSRDVLTIGAEPIKKEKAPEQPEGVKVHRVERTSRYRDRAVRLPEDVDTDKMDATFEDGVVMITIPKKPAEERKKRIAVS